MTATTETSKITKAALTSALAAKTGLSEKQALSALNGLSDIVAHHLSQGDSIPVLGGVLRPVAVAARSGRNPANGEPMEFPARVSVKFKAGSALKAAVN